MSKHTRETLGFNGFTGYYGSVPPGYGGFNWVDVNYMNATYWQNVETNWCDTGYQNAIHGAGEAFSWGQDLDSPAYSSIVTYDLNETFSLTSMTAASAWETDQPFEFRSYTYKAGHLTLKASDTVYLSQTAQTIDFARMPGGKPADFKDIAQVTIVSGIGKYGNTCTYGPYGNTTGNQMAFDKLKVKWNGTIPQGHEGNPLAKQLAPHLHPRAAHAAPHLTGGGHDGSGQSPAPVHHAESSGYHAELLPLAADGQFALPEVTHFGT